MELFENFLLQEVSMYAPKQLKDMEKCFEQLQINFKSAKPKNELVKIIQSFFRIPKITILLNNEKNVGVAVIYKPATLKNTIEDMFTVKDINKSIDPNELKKLKFVNEPADTVEEIYLILGKPVLAIMTPAEMVSIILHEMGHVFYVTTSVPYQFSVFMTSIARLVNFTVAYGIIFKYLPSIFSLFTLLNMGIIHSISFRRRAEEYSSDKYATKYGYGDELLRALNKFGPPQRAPTTIMGKVKNILTKFAEFFFFLAFPQSHPAIKKRLDRLEDQIFNEFKTMYPQYHEAINIIHQNYKKKNKEVVVV